MTDQYCKISLKKLNGKETHIGYHNREFKTLFGGTKVSPHLPFTRSELFQNSRQHSHGMSISGVQQKLSIKESESHKLIATACGGEYILKPSPEAYPNAAENEHAAMRASLLLGINTAQCGLVSLGGGELAYITKRFDRLSNGDKLHQEDLLQCFDEPAINKYSKTYEEAGKILNQATGNKQAVTLDFVQRIIFAYIIGNNDLHLKNFSLQRLAGNTSPFYDKLTPNYDCLFCEAFNEKITGSDFLALGLLYDENEGGEFFTESFEHYGYYTSGDFIELGRRLGLRDKPVVAFIEKVKTNRKKIIDLITHSFMPDEMKLRASATVEARLTALGK